jgi:hypothetical protein
MNIGNFYPWRRASQPIIDNWNQTEQNIQSQIQGFYQKFSSSLQIEELDTIDKNIQTEIERRNLFSKHLEKRQSELQKSWFTLKSPKIWIITGIEGASFITTGIVLTYEIFFSNKEDEEKQRKIAYAFGLLSSGLAALSSIYQMISFLNQEEHSKLIELNKQGIEHEEIFRKFIQKYKKLKELAIKFFELQKSMEHLSQSIINPSLIEEFQNKIRKECEYDRAIEECLQYCELLPYSSKQEEIYFKILSEAIKYLDKHDPIQQAIQELRTFVISNHPTVPPLSHSYLSSAESESWENEQGMGAENTNETFMTQENLQQSWDRLHCILKERFKVNKTELKIELADGEEITEKEVLFRSPLSTSLPELKVRQKEKTPVNYSLDIRSTH